MTGPKASPINSVDDPSGKTIHVRPATSYYESVRLLNERFKAAGKLPVTIVDLPDALEDEDKLEMVNAAVVDIVVVDDWLGKMWAQVLPNITVHDDIKLRTDAKVGWVIRKDSPKLTAGLNDFYLGFANKQGVIAYPQAMMMKRVKQIRNNTEGEYLKRFRDTLAFFKKYGCAVRVRSADARAQGYQESQLNQNAKSHVGAIGIMQIMPPTGKQLWVGDIHVTEANVHAGAKYMDQLMTKYFPDAHFSEGNRPLFAAAYNAGPGNIAKMRKTAAQQGIDLDKWFNNVEVVTAERIGIETATYVPNICKYVAYKLTMEALDTAKKARE